MLITLYLSTQMYGGCEEGGWWYDYRELAKDTPPIEIRSGNKNLAYEVCRNLNALERMIEDNEGKPDYTSVLSEGQHRSWHVENERGEDESTTRPYYE